ncbi:MAG: hypothetical protein M1820_008995 [Bogoriella megaspora]|nr:MAG: hypothetical protein M1820_008995 [Bogoriella megaspora]
MDPKTYFYIPELHNDFHSPKPQHGQPGTGHEKSNLRRVRNTPSPGPPLPPAPDVRPNQEKGPILPPVHNCAICLRPLSRQYSHQNPSRGGDPTNLPSICYRCRVKEVSGDPPSRSPTPTSGNEEIVRGIRVVRVNANDKNRDPGRTRPPSPGRRISYDSSSSGKAPSRLHHFQYPVDRYERSAASEEIRRANNASPHRHRSNSESRERAPYDDRVKDAEYVSRTADQARHDLQRCRRFASDIRDEYKVDEALNPQERGRPPRVVEYRYNYIKPPVGYSEPRQNGRAQSPRVPRRHSLAQAPTHPIKRQAPSQAPSESLSTKTLHPRAFAQPYTINSDSDSDDGPPPTSRPRRDHPHPPASPSPPNPPQRPPPIYPRSNTYPPANPTHYPPPPPPPGHSPPSLETSRPTPPPRPPIPDFDPDNYFVCLHRREEHYNPPPSPHHLHPPHLPSRRASDPSPSRGRPPLRSRNALKSILRSPSRSQFRRATSPGGNSSDRTRSSSGHRVKFALDGGRDGDDGDSESEDEEGGWVNRKTKKMEREMDRGREKFEGMYERGAERVERGLERGAEKVERGIERGRDVVGRVVDDVGVGERVERGVDRVAEKMGRGVDRGKEKLQRRVDVGKEGALGGMRVYQRGWERGYKDELMREDDERRRERYVARGQEHESDRESESDGERERERYVRARRREHEGREKQQQRKEDRRQLKKDAVQYDPAPYDLPPQK